MSGCCKVREGVVAHSGGVLLYAVVFNLDAFLNISVSKRPEWKGKRRSLSCQLSSVFAEGSNRLQFPSQIVTELAETLFKVCK